MQQTFPAQIGVLDSNTEQEKKLEVRYTVTSCDCEGDIPHRGYGIHVVLLENGELAEESSIDDISPSAAEVENLARCLAAGFVTPATFRDVVEDYLGDPERYSDHHFL